MHVMSSYISVGRTTVIQAVFSAVAKLLIDVVKLNW